MTFLCVLVMCVYVCDGGGGGVGLCHPLYTVSECSCPM